MKKRWRTRPSKMLLKLSNEQKQQLREWIAKTWQAIGKLRQEHSCDSKKMPWNPCEAAQRNFVAWCYRHKFPIAWEQFVYYFGLRDLYPRETRFSRPSLPRGMTLASIELQVATGTDPRATYDSYSYLRMPEKKKKEPLESVKDSWQVMLTVAGEDGERVLKQKVIIEAEAWSVSSEEGDFPLTRWRIQFPQNPRFGGPRYRAITTVDLMSAHEVMDTDDNYNAWWQPVLSILKPEIRGYRFKANAQPLTYRAKHEISRFSHRYE